MEIPLQMTYTLSEDHHAPMSHSMELNGRGLVISYSKACPSKEPLHCIAYLKTKY